MLPTASGFPITDPGGPVRSQVYPGPKVLVVDPLCYSATDIFAAGFADHGIGPILGVGASTGAGGGQRVVTPSSAGVARRAAHGRTIV